MDSAYRSVRMRRYLNNKGFRSDIHRKGAVNVLKLKLFCGFRNTGNKTKATRFSGTGSS